MIVTFDPFAHEYRDENGNTVISVTQLLSKHELSPSYDHVNNNVLAQSSEKGTKVHKQFETAINTEGLDDSENPAVREFIDHFYYSYTKWQSEKRVCIGKDGNRIPLAGTIDLICYAGNGRWLIGDIKTTSTLHRESVAWQLTLYRMLWCWTNHVSVEYVDLFCLHVVDGQCKWIDITPIDQAEVDHLMKCEEDNVPYCRSKAIQDLKAEERLLAYEKQIIQLKSTLKELQEKEEKVKDEIYNFLSEKGILKLESDIMLITVVPPTTATTFDSKEFSEKHPDLYKQFLKTTPREGYLKVTVRNKNGKN